MSTKAYAKEYQMSTSYVYNLLTSGVQTTDISSETWQTGQKKS